MISRDDLLECVSRNIKVVPDKRAEHLQLVEEQERFIQNGGKVQVLPSCRATPCYEGKGQWSILYGWRAPR